MATCPKCRGGMDAQAAACPHCGYDFPPPPDRRFVPLWQLALVLAATAGAVVWFEDNPVVQVASGVCGLLFWLGLSLDLVWFFRGR